MAAAEFAVNNKVYTVTKVSPFMANYGKELRMGGDIRRKGKVESATEFVEKMKKVYEEVEAVLKKTQEEMKRYTDRNRKETKKLMERYVGPYATEEVVSSNTVKL